MSNRFRGDEGPRNILIDFNKKMRYNCNDEFIVTLYSERGKVHVLEMYHPDDPSMKHYLVVDDYGNGISCNIHASFNVTNISEEPYDTVIISQPKTRGTILLIADAGLGKGDGKNVFRLSDAEYIVRNSDTSYNCTLVTVNPL